MVIKGLVDEDFIQYKKPSMFIIFPYCDFKCDKEAGCTICQNSALANEPNINISIMELVTRYISNPITKAIVFGGLEPFDSLNDLLCLIFNLRLHTNDDIIIYTGYTEKELEQKNIFNKLKDIQNIIIKFGRFIPNQEKHYDEVLGVELASPNQYAKQIGGQRELKISKNPDPVAFAAIQAKVKENDGYCPCALIKDNTTRCPCLEFRQRHTEGECHCGLYIKEYK